MAQCKPHLEHFCNLTQNIHVCLHLQYATTSDISNTVKCVDPNTDVLEQLNMYIQEEIEQLYNYIQQTLENQQVICHLCGQASEAEAWVHLGLGRTSVGDTGPRQR